MALFDSNEPAKNGRGGAGRRDSEEIAPGYPVMPIADCFGGGFVRIDGDHLGKRSSHVPVLPYAAEMAGIGGEQAGFRPALVLSVDLFNVGPAELVVAGRRLGRAGIGGNVGEQVE